MDLRKKIVTEFLNGHLFNKSYAQIEREYKIPQKGKPGDVVRSWINWFENKGSKINQYAPGCTLNEEKRKSIRFFDDSKGYTYTSPDSSLSSVKGQSVNNLLLRKRWQAQTKTGTTWLESYENKINPEEIKKFREELIKDIPSVKRAFTPKAKSNYDVLAVISIPDFHIGRERYSAVNDYTMNDVVTDLLIKSSHHYINNIVFVIGNDYFNSDFDYKTTKGTPQFDYQNWKETWINGRNILLNTIEVLKNKKCPIHIINVPGNHDCYSDDTEVLTKEGFKKHIDLKADDLIATLNPITLETEYQPYTNYFVDNYSGDAAYFEHKSLNSIVTLNHRLFVRNHNDDFYQYIKVEDLIKDDSKSYSFRVFGENRRKDADISDDFIKLLAWINTDGSIDKRIRTNEYKIFQSKVVYVQELRDLFSRLNIGYNEYCRERSDKEYIIEGKTIKSVLDQYVFSLNEKNSGKDFIDALNRTITDKYKIPRILFECSRRQAEIYIREYIKGDGSAKINTTQDWAQVYGTKSILDDLQHLCVVNGITCKYNLNIRGDHELYINFKKSNKRLTTDEISIKSYSGKIWCLQVPNSNFFTRRNGVVAIQGNSNRMFMLGDYVEGYYKNDEQITVDNSDNLIKIYQHGDVLLAFEHGEFRQSEYESILASNYPAEWGSSTYREFLCGHLHAETVKEFRGLKLRHLPSLAKESEWEKKQGYSHKKEAQMLVYSKHELEAIYIS